MFKIQHEWLIFDQSMIGKDRKYMGKKLERVGRKRHYQFELLLEEMSLMSEIRKVPFRMSRTFFTSATATNN